MELRNMGRSGLRVSPIGANRCISVQGEYSLAYRGHEKELLPALETHELVFIPYRPLASGVLTGTPTRAPVT